MYGRGIDAQVGEYDDTYSPCDYMSQAEYMGEALREFAANHGERNQDAEWILSPFDTWLRNPFYTGKPGRHPEDDHYDEDEE